MACYSLSIIVFIVFIIVIRPRPWTIAGICMLLATISFILLIIILRSHIITTRVYILAVIFRADTIIHDAFPPFLRFNHKSVRKITIICYLCQYVISKYAY